MTDWARQAKAGAFLKDPQEVMVISGNLRIYSIVAALFVAVAFGKCSDAVFGDMDGVLQGPALALVLANVGVRVSFVTVKLRIRTATRWCGASRDSWVVPWRLPNCKNVRHS